MPDKKTTWYAAQRITIQSHQFEVGDVLGTGEGADFRAAEGLEAVVSFGHIKARLNYKTVTSEKPEVVEPEPETDPESEPLDLSKMKKAELMDLAAANDIPLNGASSVEELRSVIATALAQGAE